MTELLTVNIIILAFLLPVLINSLANLFTLRSLRDYTSTEEQPPVSILVPARDEETDIAGCVNSLLAQDYPDFEVVVLDDHSSDDTWKILEGIAAQNERLRIDKGLPLEAGWLGKHWVCHQLSRKATGEILLFTDADTVHRPSTLKRAVAAIISEKADLITALPEQLMPSFAEKLIMPFSYWFIMSFMPLGLAYSNQNPQLAAATGQFMLFRRSAYEKIGGFEAVRNMVVDDVELCRRIRSHGLRWRLLDGHDDFRVRQYTNLKSLIEGHTKNLFAELQHRLIVYLIAIISLLVVFLLPPVSLVMSAGSASIIIPAAAACVLISLATWLIAYLRFGLPWYMAFFYPLTALSMAALALESLRLHYARKATWKGRIVSAGS